MSLTCAASVSPNNCGHRTLTIVRDDGSTLELEFTENEANTPLTLEEERLFAALSLRRLRTGPEGVTLANAPGRVLIGSEATNVRSYNLLGPGAAVTKTNIGTAYTNVCPGVNGERMLVDLVGVTEYRLVVTATLTGTGPFGLRVVRDSDSAVLYENANIALTGNQELDTDWQILTLPAGAVEALRLQAKSNTAADDPVFRRATLLVR